MNNAERSAMAERALSEYIASDPHDLHSDVQDLLTDLLHWADRNLLPEWDMFSAFERARDQYTEEITCTCGHHEDRHVDLKSACMVCQEEGKECPVFQGQGDDDEPAIEGEDSDA